MSTKRNLLVSNKWFDDESLQLSSCCTNLQQAISTACTNQDWYTLTTCLTALYPGQPK